jgi:hypothetical protein
METIAKKFKYALAEFRYFFLKTNPVKTAKARNIKNCAFENGNAL